MATKSLVHVNNNIICSLDVETTGTRPGYHEIIQAVFLPLDNNLEPRKDLPLFDIRMRPTYIERIDANSLSINKQQLNIVIETGIEQERGVELFEHWYSKLNLQPTKRIIPLGHNITGFDLPFIQDWIGATMFNEYFNVCARDTIVVANYLNDVSDFHGEQTPFAKLRLSYLAHKLGIEVFEQGTHDALYDAYLAAQVYKKMVTHHLLELV